MAFKWIEKIKAYIAIPKNLKSIWYCGEWYRMIDSNTEFFFVIIESIAR